MDVVTLFAANALILLVMAGGFLAMWTTDRQEICWASWTAANVTLAVGLILFIVVPARSASAMAAPNAMLALGLGLRWRAARQFTRSFTSWSAVVMPPLGVLMVFSVPRLLEETSVFAIVNLLLACQATAIAWHFAVRRSQAPASSYGLIFAYGILALSSVIRAGQGIAEWGQFTSYLPHDGMLELHLVMAIVHASASGAFALTIAHERAAGQLRSERDRVMARALAFERLSEHDPLTGLMNRRAIEPRFADLQREGFTALAIVDLDHFKRINDWHGHLVGDEVLCHAASALAPDRDCLAVRIGGEEFMLLLRGKRIRERAERRRRAITARVAAGMDGLKSPVTASMGLVELPPDMLEPMDFRELYAAADRLLYEAKADGRNRAIMKQLTLFAEPSRSGLMEDDAQGLLPLHAVYP